jgi:hypothetical protein
VSIRIRFNLRASAFAHAPPARESLLADSDRAFINRRHIPNRPRFEYAISPGAHCITERFWLSPSARRSRRIAQSGFRSACSRQGARDADINHCDSAGSHNTTIVLPLSFAQK